MRAGKHQTETAIGDIGGVDAVSISSAVSSMSVGCHFAMHRSIGVEEFAARDGHEPCFSVFRQPVRGQLARAAANASESASSAAVKSRVRAARRRRVAITAARNLLSQVPRLHAVSASAHDLHRPDGTHFNDAVLRTGATGSPRKGGIEVGRVDEEVTASCSFESA